jgi:hypothetical protein
MIRSKKLRDSARDEPCTMNSPMCNGNPETVVWCHSNFHEHGKGVGLKAHDVFGFYGCSGCHQWFDHDSKRYAEGLADRRDYYQRAHDKSIVRAIEKGVIRV